MRFEAFSLGSIHTAGVTYKYYMVIDRKRRKSHPKSAAILMGTYRC
jgi:hypothetical protein